MDDLLVFFVNADVAGAAAEDMFDGVDLEAFFLPIAGSMG